MPAVEHPRQAPLLRTLRLWAAPAALAAVLFLIYSVNRREIAGGDSTPAKFLTLALLRGDGLYLDRYAGHEQFRLGRADGLGHWATRSRGHVVSLYPVTPALAALPVAAPLIAYFDARHPGWDVSPSYNWRYDFIAKTSAAAIAAATGVVLLSLLRGLGLGRAALAATLAAMLGSEMWAVASQSLWQHGPAALCLVLALRLTLPSRCPAWRLALGGLAAAIMVTCRPTAAVFAAALAAGVGWRRPRDLIPFLVSAAPVALALAAYNLRFFGSLAGGYSEDSNAYLPPMPLAGLAGTLLSPNRGLFIFCPWVVAAIAILPLTAKRLKCHPVVSAALMAVPLHLAVVSAWPCWWAGCAFGPRFWTEVMPLFAVPAGLALSWAARRSRVVLWAVLAAVAWSVGIQAVGVFCGLSSWNAGPPLVDDAPGRCWDWRDTELGRCLAEGVKVRKW